MKAIAFLLLAPGLAYAITSPHYHNVEMSTTDFATKLYKAIANNTKPNSNILFSPLGVYAALVMLKSGAKRNTVDAIEEALNTRQMITDSGSKTSEEAISKIMDGPLKSLHASNMKGSKAYLINRLWLQEGFCTSYCKHFESIMEGHFNATMDEVNFIRDSEAAMHLINKWIEGKTDMNIKNTVPRGIADAKTLMVLTNAIAFKAKWQAEFSSRFTVKRKFNAITRTGFSTKSVNVVHQQGESISTSYIENPAYQLIDIPFENKELSLMLVMPKDLSEMQRMEQRTLTTSKIQKMFQELYNFDSSQLEIQFPKFKVNSRIDLKASLQDIGLKELFKPNADLSGIVGYIGLYLTNAVHDAYINVDEKGGTSKTGNRNPVPWQIRVDRPFIFMVRHKPSGTILFMGRIVDPEAE